MIPLNDEIAQIDSETLRGVLQAALVHREATDRIIDSVTAELKAREEQPVITAAHRLAELVRNECWE